jgi:hypothetical protein
MVVDWREVWAPLRLHATAGGGVKQLLAVALDKSLETWCWCPPAHPTRGRCAVSAPIGDPKTRMPRATRGGEYIYFRLRCIITAC